GAVADAQGAAAVPPEGVGLFRTEVLYLGRGSAPPVQAQVEAYRAVFDAFTGRKVVIRTLDAGECQLLQIVGHAEEANPALGVRGLRLARRRPELLADQLTAIAQAASGCGADVWVMAPMVSTPAEAEQFADQARSPGLATVGAMVEVPAAAMRAAEMLDGLDF